MTSPRLKSDFKSFFAIAFQDQILQAQVGKHLFETVVLVLKILDHCNIRSLHAALSGLPVAAGDFRDTSLPEDIFNGSSGFNRFSHGDDPMLSQTGFTNADLLHWQIDYAGGSLNVNGTIMRDTYKINFSVYTLPRP